MSGVPRSIELTADQGKASCRLSGDWLQLHSSASAWEEWEGFWRRNEGEVRQCVFSLDVDSRWDSSLLLFLIASRSKLAEGHVSADFSELPPKVRKLVDFSDARLSAGKEARQSSDKNPWALAHPLVVFAPIFFFWGKWVIALLRVPMGKSFMRWRDLLEACRNCGASALPIVTLIAFLTGLTMAFVGSVQLEKFNATIYVADLVSLAMVREMGALMVAIVMAGRTGASFAAELGSMKIREEIDSLRTFGIPALDFLVLPRTIGLFIMTPVLTLYADVVGMLGGLTVGVQVMEFSHLHYLEQTQSALNNMWEIYSGLIKSLAFGLIIGLVGCYKGMHTGDDSASLGRSVTSSVVTSITLIVVFDALFEVTFSLLGFR